MSCASGGAGELQWKKAGFDSSQHFRLVGLFFSSLLLPRFSLTHYVYEVSGQERYDRSSSFYKETLQEIKHVVLTKILSHRSILKWSNFEREVK